MVVPQLALSLAASLTHARRLSAGLTPQPVRMHNTLDGNLGLIHAEALSFALAEMMPRPEAQAKAKALCREAGEKRIPLQKLALADYPDLADAVAGFIIELRRHRPAADAGLVRLDDADDIRDVVPRDTRAGVHTQRRAVAGGDVRVRAVVDVQQCRVGAFEEDALAAIDLFVQQRRGVGQVRHELLGERFQPFQ